MKNHNKNDIKAVKIMKIALSIWTTKNIYYLDLATEVYIKYNYFNFKIFFNKLFLFFQIADNNVYVIFGKLLF